MPPKTSLQGVKSPASPLSPKVKNNETGELPVGDLNTFFRVLRFISAHPELATLASATATATTSVVQVSSPVQTGSPSSPLTGATDGVAAAPPPRSQTGTSTAVGNRIRIPPILNDPLEDYRMLATNLPINEEGLIAARQRVRAVLEDLCKELGKAEVTAALNDEVFAGADDDLAASQNSTSLNRSVTSCGTIRRASNFGMNSLQEMQEIIPGLWCGSYRPASDLDLLKRHGVTHVCCCIGTQPRFPGELMYLSFSADDRNDYDITPHFARTFEFIENALVKSHGGVLVHCGAGISRAPTIIAAYLMRKLRISSTAAIHMVQHHRACASPNMGFRRQLHEYGVKLGVNEQTPNSRGTLANASFAKAATALKSKETSKASLSATPSGSNGGQSSTENSGNMSACPSNTSSTAQ